MSIAKARRLIVEVLEQCKIDARTKSLLELALAETWRIPPERIERTPVKRKDAIVSAS